MHAYYAYYACMHACRQAGMHAYYACMHARTHACIVVANFCLASLPLPGCLANPSFADAGGSLSLSLLPGRPIPSAGNELPL